MPNCLLIGKKSIFSYLSQLPSTTKLSTFQNFVQELWFNEEFCNTCTSTVKNNLSKCNKHNKEKDVGNRYTLSLFQSQWFFTITVYKSQEDWSLEDVVKQKKQKGCILKSKTTTITLWISRGGCFICIGSTLKCLYGNTIDYHSHRRQQGSVRAKLLTTNDVNTILQKFKKVNSPLLYGWWFARKGNDCVLCYSKCEMRIRN